MAVQTNKLHASQLEFLKRFEFVVVVPDGDAGGNRFIDSLSEYVEVQTFLIAHMPKGKDPGNLDETTLDRCIQHATRWEPILEKREVEYEF
jgi:DNA primase